MILFFLLAYVLTANADDLAVAGNHAYGKILRLFFVGPIIVRLHKKKLCECEIWFVSNTSSKRNQELMLSFCFDGLPFEWGSSRIYVFKPCQHAIKFLNLGRKTFMTEVAKIWKAEVDIWLSA